MRKIIFIAWIPVALAVFSAGCKTKTPESGGNIHANDSSVLLKKGDSISSEVQKVLLGHVMQAMKSGGPGFAVAFCNEKAMALTDSLGQVYNCTIQRITDRNRNPANRLSEDDAEIIASFPASHAAYPRLVLQNQIPVYYKPIKIAMPACLVCHGTEGKDIEAKTLAIIRQKYPEDKATGYKEGDLRGWWKITFTAE
jgi:hypothetical protein